MTNPDLQHKKEYEKYLERLNGQTNLSPRDESYRQERIASTNRMLDQVNSRLIK